MGTPPPPTQLGTLLLPGDKGAPELPHGAALAGRTWPWPWHPDTRTRGCGVCARVPQPTHVHTRGARTPPGYSHTHSVRVCAHTCTHACVHARPHMHTPVCSHPQHEHTPVVCSHPPHVCSHPQHVHTSCMSVHVPARTLAYAHPFAHPPTPAHSYSMHTPICSHIQRAHTPAHTHSTNTHLCSHL